MASKNIVLGSVYNSLTVIGKSDGKKWVCRCICGKIKLATYGHLNSGFVKSCGCQRGTHRASNTKLWFVWRSMNMRCRPDLSEKFPNYGGRGIKVCERWKSYANFHKDMGNSYSAGLSLDRIDNDGDYCFENCKWANHNEQNRNKRTNLWVEYNGERRILSDWAKETGIKLPTISYRYHKMGLRGVDLFLPVMTKNKK